MEEAFKEQIAYIESALRDAGYDPYAQLIGFIRTQDERFITRQGNARSLITKLDRNLLNQYILQYLQE